MVHFFYKLSSPRSTNIDTARREFILNSLLLGSIALSIVAFVDRLINDITHNVSRAAVPSNIIFFCIIFLCLLLHLSHKGKIRFSSISLILLLYIPTLYLSYLCGADVPQGIIFYALVSVMAGILINSKASFIITFISTIYLLIITYFEVNNIVKPMVSWKSQGVTMGDSIVTAATLVIIAVVTWLWNRGMEHALERARNSEDELRKERDNLEITVAERTKALRIAQMEKVAQLERSAEIGRISSGLIHDLVTPLNLVSLNLERMARLGKKIPTEHFNGSDELLQRAMIGMKRLESFVSAARRQVQNHEINEYFMLDKEISQLLQVLTYLAKEKHITIIFHSQQEIRTYGNPTKFNQVITNLLLNAMDAYDSIPTAQSKKKIIIQVTQNKQIAQITVQDFGKGISKKNMSLIYRPFFTTKKAEKGMGIGLSITKEIVDKYFKGTLFAVSSVNKGTTFTFEFPIVTKRNKKNV